MTRVPRVAASQSFSEEEAQLLDRLLKTLQYGGDVSVMMRQPAFGSICRKAVAMRLRVEELRRKKTLSDTRGTDEAG